MIEILVFAALEPRFLGVKNFTNIAVQSSIIGIVSVAFGLLLITGFIDLSVGSTLALAAVVAGNLLVDGHGTTVAILGALLAGALVGAVNGTLAAFMKFSPIIVTLGVSPQSAGWPSGSRKPRRVDLMTPSERSE